MFQTLLVAATDGIIVSDALGKIRIFNDACARLFGYKRDEVIGKNVAMLMPALGRDAHDNDLQVSRCYTIGRRKDGSGFPIHLSAGRAQVDGAAMTVGIVRDLTAPSGGAQFEALAATVITQAGASLAHEINQPLAAVMNYAKAAERTLEPSEDPRAAKARDLVVKATEQVARASNVIRDFRDLIGKREPDCRAARLETIVAEGIALGLAGAADSNVTVTLALDPDLPPVLVDKAQIQQVVLNLVRNAVEAMREAPVRELSVRSSSGEGVAATAQVTVCDTGTGFSEEIAGRLFKPFVTTKQSRMGLGLTICQSIINAHGGRLWAEPNAGAGVSFHFQLPFSTKTED